MKLKQLTIDNIASIEHAEINFDAAPLVGEHLFLITGETGSGKSTIIDCLCLALYGNTPRLKAARKDDYDTKRHNGQDDEKLKTDDVRQLLRRGAVTADVCLTFDDNDGIPYIAKWHVHRANKKLEKNIKQPERTLMTDEGVNPPVCLQGKKAIDPHIFKLIGLDMDQFFRTVVLAQGKFAEFLNSEEKDKATLLEKMTGTDIYAKVGSKIYAVCDDKLQKRNNLLEQLQNIELLNEDQKASIGDEIGELGKQQALVQARRDGAKAMNDWLDAKAQNERNLGLKRQELDSKQEQATKPEYLEQHQLVIDWENTIEPRREARDLQQALSRIKRMKEQQPAMQEEFDHLCAALRATIVKTEKMRSQREEIGEFIKQEAPNKGMYESIKTIKTLMGQRKLEQDNITSFTKALKQEQDNLPKAEDRVKATREAMQQQDIHVKELQARYDALKLSDITKRKDELGEAQLALTVLKTKNDAVAQVTTLIEGFKTDLDNEQQALEKVNASIDSKRALKTQAFEALEREKDWNALIEQAHKSLHKGQTCPVCGNVINDLQPPKGKNVLDELKERLALATSDVENAEAAIAASGKAIKRITKQITDAERDLADRITNRDKQWQQTAALLEKCGKQAGEMPDNTRCDALVQAIESDVEALNATLRQATVLNNTITAERDKLTQLTDEHNQATIHYNKAIDSIKHQGEVIDASKARFKARTDELNTYLAMSDWETIAAQQNDFIEQLELKANRYQQQVSTAQQLEQSIGVAQALIPAMQENKGNITGLVDNGTVCDRIPDNLDELWRQFENKSINWNNALDNEKNSAERASQALDKYLSEHPDMSKERIALIDQHSQGEIAGIKQSHKELEERMTHIKGEIASLSEQHNDILAKKPDFPEQDREKLAEIFNSSQERFDELNDQIAERKAILKNDEENVKTVGEKKKALDIAEADYKRWAELCEELGSKNGDKFKRIAQSYILGELLHSANGYLQQFNDRYELEAKPGSLIILVRDLMQGDLTSVNTLSGGESFMVSLALALALSSTTGKMFSVDTLFIDEGFGSLSENYLDNVMETLNRLYDMGGRRVGIISHVKLLKERVTTQIQVSRDPKNNTVSRIEIV